MARAGGKPHSMAGDAAGWLSPALNLGPGPALPSRPPPRTTARASANEAVTRVCCEDDVGHRPDARNRCSAPANPQAHQLMAAPMVRRRKMRLNIWCSEPNTVIRASIGVCTVGLVVCGW